MLRDLLNDVVPNTGFFRGAATIASATAAAQLVTILAAPLIARLYSPAAYGAYAAAAAVLALLVSVACLRYDLAIPLPGSDVEAANVLALCLAVTLAIGLLLIPILAVAGPALLQAMGAQALDVYAWLLPFGVLAGGAFAAFVGWMVRTKAFREIGASQLTQSGTVVGFQIAFGFFGAGAAGLLVAWILGSVAATGRLARTTWRLSAGAVRQFTGQGIRAAAVRFRRFPIFSTPSIAMNMIGLQAPLVWMVAAFGPATGGQFALAQRIVALPVGVVAAAVGQVFFAEAARVAQDQPHELGRLFTRTTRTLVLVAGLPFLAGAIASPFLFPIIFGPAWTVAGVYVAILAPMYFLQFATWPTGAVLDVLERQDLHLIREIGRLLFVGGTVAAATAAGLASTEAVVAVSFAGCLTNLWYGAISWRAVRAASVRPRPVQGAGGNAPL